MTQPLRGKWSLRPWNMASQRNLCQKAASLFRAVVHYTRKDQPRFRVAPKPLLAVPNIALSLRELLGCFFPAFCCGEHGSIKSDGVRPV
ncbi:hypothetical protein [Bradyrhizobium erythrophlei]|uniref:Uncharacterized protein n=1 Tax=Bradyrhizobium erythrophlei TaxID=1437360 RepID=A0A1H4UQZ4_9BRAD|nr:hypothetical protein [Bradyrhizobium erythrophlei]SEC70848.1 hypothetical protein SAMN05444164_2538 [Bradyrhizobium erythrophlei]